VEPNRTLPRWCKILEDLLEETDEGGKEIAEKEDKGND